MSHLSVIKRYSVSNLKAPLTQPFRTALGAHNLLENILFELELMDGTKGYGEAAVAGHITGETVHGTFHNLQTIGGELLGRDIADYLQVSSYLHDRLESNKAALGAIETAIVDSLTRQLKIPLWKFFGKSAPDLCTDITIVIADIEETEIAVKKFYKKGFRCFKVKVGQDPELDFKRVLAVKRHAPRCSIILDANQGYSAEETLDFLKAVKKSGVSPVYIEQPVPKSDWEGLVKVTRSAGIPVCVDESVQSLADAVRIVQEKAADVINIKLMKTGIFQSRDIAFLAKANGIKLMIGGMMESSLSMTAAAHFAAGLGGFDFVDLDTPFFIKAGYDKNPYLSSKGVYQVKKVSEGIGIIPRVKG